jgi:putative transposase
LTYPLNLHRYKYDFGYREKSNNKHSEAQIIGALNQIEAGRTGADVGGSRESAGHTIYAWKAKYGGLEVNEAQRLRSLEDESSRPTWLVAELSLDPEMLKAVIAKNGFSS